MFFSYLGRELRRRSKQAAVVALGLGLGIGLVVTVSSASAGVKTAQAKVLHSLYGVGTDISVTETATAGSGGPAGFRFGSGGASGTRPKAGQSFSRNRLTPTPGQATFAETAVSSVAKLKNVNSVSAGLTLNDTSFSGTFGSSGGGGFGGGSSTGSAAGSSFKIKSFSVAGVQPTSTGVGLLASNEITSGRYFTNADSTSKVAILSSSYAKQEKLGVNSTVNVAGTKLKVVGIATMPSGSSTDVFVPLAEAQKLTGETGKVTTLYVSVVSAGDVSAAASSIQHALPKATVTTSADLAKNVTGSLSSASNLATNLGKWLSIAALLAAFLIAALLMMGAVSRRVREFGTLKALGWRTRRVVGQVMGEGLAQGIVGGVLGIGLGIGGAALVGAFAPSLSATTGPSFATGGGGAFGGGAFGGGSFPRRTGSGAPGRNAADLSHTVLVHLSAPLQGSTLLLAVVLAVAGGIVAGGFGAWRAARLRPAAALRKVE